MRNSTLCVVISILTFFTATAVHATNYSNYGTATTYNLYAGDTLRIKSGTYTGTIATFYQNAVIIVEDMANFRPNYMANPRGNLINNGHIQIGTLSPNSAFILQNFSDMVINGDLVMNGFQTWYNRYGATLDVSGDVILNSLSALSNEGTITIGGDLEVKALSSLLNKNVLTTAGNLTVSFGEFVNEGETITSGTLSFDWLSAFTNKCRMVTEGGFTNSSYNFQNLGLLWVGTTGTTADHFINNGTFTNGPNGIVRSVRFTNNGTINGAGKMYFTGQTINYGTMGTSGYTTDTIRVYDVTRTNPSKIFDVQSGTVRANVVYNVFAAPDTNSIPGDCSNLFKTDVLLPVKWSAFFVNIANNVPVLNWASQQTEGTIFEIQRSYDGSNFTTIADMLSNVNQESYNFVDRNVNTQASVVYYRIKGVELSGAVSYTEVRLVKFANKEGITIQVAPNPFTSQVSINYQSSERGNITIRVFNMNGQLHMAKNATVSNGYNSITVTGLSNLAKGMYVLQVSGENGVIATERIVKN